MVPNSEKKWDYYVNPSLFIPIDRRASILRKVKRKVFLMKPKHQYHLSQWEECVYGAQSWNERGLLCESLFVQIDRRTLILKMVERKFFLMKP